MRNMNYYDNAIIGDDEWVYGNAKGSWDSRISLKSLKDSDPKFRR